MKRLVKFLAASAVAMGVAQAANAQSTYGCRDLDGFHSLPSVEGADGVFFRVQPELYTHHPFSDETVEDVALLSQSLASLGTTLVYAPVPPKSMVLTKQLPLRAYDYGFDPNVATSLYDDMVDRLQKAGVVTANLRRAFVVGGSGFELPYFKTDYRLNSFGSRLMAQAIAQELSQNANFMRMPRGGFSNQSQGMQEIDSDMRRVLQRHCLIKLPKVETEVFVTGQRGGVGNTQGGTSIFGNASQTGQIAVVGTEFSSEPALNFGGFLSEMTGLAVDVRSVPNGGAYGAISSYLTSEEFKQARPAILVWENPVYHNLAQYGDQPMRELVAASGSSCRMPIPVLASLDANRIQADLSSLNPSQDYTLLLETGGSDASQARFVFTSPTGATRTSTVSRRLDQQKTGQFYVPVSGMWREGIRTLDIELDAPFGGTPRISACFF